MALPDACITICGIPISRRRRRSIDVTRNGRRVPALGLIGKTAWMFLLDRTNGTPVFGVEERPVPKGDVPGEWYSPTQPFPVKPPALARVDFKKEDLVTAADTTPEHEKNCLALYEKAGGFYNAGPFTPFLFHEDGAPPKSTIQFPGNGGTNWGGPAGDPSLGYIFAFTQDAALTGWIEKKRAGGNYGSGQRLAAAVRPRQHHRTGPVLRVLRVDGAGAAAGSLSAAAVGTPHGRERRHRRVRLADPLGVTDGLPPEKQNTGRGGSAGPIVTAGGLVFIGTTADARFRAIDSKTGQGTVRHAPERQRKRHADDVSGHGAASSRSSCRPPPGRSTCSRCPRTARTARTTRTFSPRAPRASASATRPSCRWN